MRLKKLKISGFKSFADRVTIDFDAAIIGIVGPNGCGKSNIVDAFRFCLGEQSAKSLRGGKMDDVLFSGAQQRAATKGAEVSLTFTEIGGALATDLDELTITRKLFVDGESHYLINAEQVRLKDVQNLFLGSGVGRRAFSIFEQGKIEHVINLPPLQRRSLFDEAAGVCRFLERKKETVQKLVKVEENYVRLSDLYAEVQRQTKALKKQADAALEHQRKKERLKQLEQQLIITRLKKVTLKEGEQQLHSLEQNAQIERDLVEQLQNKSVELSREKEQLEKKVSLQLQEFYELESKAKIQSADFQRQLSRKGELERRALELQSAIEGARAAEQQKLDLDETKLQKALSLALQQLKERQKEQMELVKKQAEVSFLLKERQKQIAKAAECEERKKKIEALSSEIDKTKEELTAFGKLEDESLLLEQIADLKAMLKESAENELLKEKQIAQRATSLSTLIKAKKGKQKLIDALLQRYQQTLVVQNRRDFDFVIAFAKKRDISSFSLFCMEDMESKEGAFCDYAESSVIASHFLGGLSSTVTESGDLIDHLHVFHFNKKKGDALQIKDTLDKAQQQLTALREVTRQMRQVEMKMQKLEMTLVSENFGFQRAIQELKGFVQIDDSVVTAINNEVKQNQELIAQLEREIKAHERALQEIKIFYIKQEERRVQKMRFLEELKEVEASLELQEQAISLQRDHVKHLDEAAADFKKRLGSSNQELQQLQQQLSKLQEQLLRQQGLVKDLEKKQHTIELELAQNRARQAELEEELMKSYQMKLEEALESDIFLEDITAAQKEFQGLKSDVEKTAAINFAAIEEFGQQQERFTLLGSQLADLKGSKEELEKMILHLDKESRRLFKETFELIRENFRRNFQTLFNGGEADLTFTESKDLLEAGVEIVAKPPGKKMRSITLLSGGEKCLTALALLFSIFEVKPAPFCILDEVDAPLDDSNIDRFTKMLKTYTEQTQFIIVTHHKRTMSVCDILLGVSMEEKGVSTLLSLTFDRMGAAT